MIKVVYVLFLGGLWFALSGHTKWYILVLGAASVLLVTYLAARMSLIDREGFPLHMAPRSPAYLAWLAARIVESNIEIARVILDPKLPLAPSRFQVRSAARSDVARVCYADSITLTPGTVTLSVDDAEIDVHALTANAAGSLADGEMDRRVIRMARES